MSSSSPNASLELISSQRDLRLVILFTDFGLYLPQGMLKVTRAMLLNPQAPILSYLFFKHSPSNMRCICLALHCVPSSVVMTNEQSQNETRTATQHPFQYMILSTAPSSKLNTTVVSRFINANKKRINQSLAGLADHINRTPRDGLHTLISTKTHP